VFGNVLAQRPLAPALPSLLIQPCKKLRCALNGGAAVALLAFIGNIYSKSQAAVSIPKGITTALAAFSFAVLLAGIATGMAYLTQRDFRRNPQKQENNFNRIGILSVTVAYILFCVGIVAAVRAFAG
jgi:hypothetical protein